MPPPAYISATTPTRWETFFLAATGILASTILLKIASIQYLELLYLLQIGLLLASFCARGFTVPWFRPYLRIGLCWLVFGLGTMLSGIAALRLHFYPPLDLPPLRAPVLITIMRNVELTANVSIMVWLAHRMRRSLALARLLLKSFFWTGIASCLFSAISYPLDLAGIVQLGSYSSLHRWRGFYNEGGPYGLYLSLRPASRQRTSQAGLDPQTHLLPHPGRPPRQPRDDLLEGRSLRRRPSGSLQHFSCRQFHPPGADPELRRSSSAGFGLVVPDRCGYRGLSTFQRPV